MAENRDQREGQTAFPQNYALMAQSIGKIRAFLFLKRSMMIPVTSPEREKTVFPSYKIYLYGRDQGDIQPSYKLCSHGTIHKFRTFLG